MRLGEVRFAIAAIYEQSNCTMAVLNGDLTLSAGASIFHEDLGHTSETHGSNIERHSSCKQTPR